MTPETCPACEAPSGTNGSCTSCRELATGALARQAAGVTPRNVRTTERQVARYLKRRPWWSRLAPSELLARLQLLRLVLHDTLRGRHWLPWHEVAMFAAAALYVISPLDLISDFFGAAGFADDLLVVSITCDLKRRQLVEYCRAKKLSPGNFGFGAEH
jgi:uncharacterized membrane protein YkvA (DUF1232 family)